VEGVGSKLDAVTDISGRDGGVLNVGENLEEVTAVGGAGHETASTVADVVPVIIVDTWGIGESGKIGSRRDEHRVGLGEAYGTGALDVEHLAAGNKGILMKMVSISSFYFFPYRVSRSFNIPS
jgi:hypothetical protein